MDMRYYDPESDEPVHGVQPDYDGEHDQDDSDMITISSASTSRTTSTITSDEINGMCARYICFVHYQTTSRFLILEYFREAHGRVFPVDENLPLTYPVDDIEVRRHQMQHTFLKALMHGNYIGPVKEVLKPRADRSRPRILDIRTCAGDWSVQFVYSYSPPSGFLNYLN